MSASPEYPVERLYSELPLLSQDSIRLLDISPGIKQLRAKLRVVSLNSRPKYEALSYTWGYDVPFWPLYVNGNYAIPMRKNLISALRRLRSSFVARTVWIDALCVNQDDPAERSQQVALMRRIYQQAEVVIVWLGHASFWHGIKMPAVFSPGSLNYLKRALTYRKRTADDLGAVKLRRWLQACWLVYLRNNDSAIVKASNNFTGDEWQSRTWTIQEFVLARKVVFYFGRRTLEYDWSLFQTLNTIAYHERSIYFREHFEMFVDRISNQLGRLKWQSVQGPNPDWTRVGIYEATRLAAGCAASDPKDLVYGLVGLLNEDEARLIGTDYSLSCAEVYARATYAAIKVKNSFNILTLVDFREYDLENASTWIVDFRNLERAHEMGQLAGLQELEYNFDKCYCLHPEPTLDSSRLYITISGVSCDVVATTISLPGLSELENTKLGSRALISAETIASFAATALCSARNALRRQYGREMGAEHGITLLRQLLGATSTTPINDLIREDVGIPHLPDARLKRREMISIALRCWNHGLSRKVDKALLKSRLWGPSLTPWLDYAQFAADRMSLISTSCGLIGFAPDSVGPGDTIVLCSGSYPFLLLGQTTPYPSEYTFCGLAYLHGLMSAEFWQRWNGIGIAPQRFTIR